MTEWNPILASPTDLKEIAGEPTSETTGELSYDFDNGYDGSYWKFKVRNETIVALEYIPGE